MWTARGWIFKTRKGVVSVSEPQCRKRAPNDAPAVLNALVGAPRTGLTAAQVGALLGHMSAAAVVRILKRMAELRYLDALGWDETQLRYLIAPTGMTFLDKYRRKQEKRPIGRPRKYAEGAPRPKRPYKPTGRPKGRPRKHPDPPALRADARGRKVRFHDAAHVAAREASARAYAAHRRPRKRLRDMTPDERQAYYERRRQEAAARTRSWRRWDTAARLTARHLAALPPEPDELSADALAWLQGAA